ncbi:hypothetical protein M0657_004926 [Pyricularia oryzae]|nr:hypothetical protein M9X92_004410 [Pyricularia oryzae]KAI7923916.1 hypothetical protein M0657_004926 [Pyricularia oryzae]
MIFYICRHASSRRSIARNIGLVARLLQLSDGAFLPTPRNKFLAYEVGSPRLRIERIVQFAFVSTSFLSHSRGGWLFFAILGAADPPSRNRCTRCMRTPVASQHAAMVQVGFGAHYHDPGVLDLLDPVSCPTAAAELQRSWMRFETLIVSLLASAAVAVPMNGDGASAALQARSEAPGNGPMPAHFAKRDPKSPGEVKEDLKKKIEADKEKARKKLEEAKKRLPKIPHLNITKPGMPPRQQVKRAAAKDMFSDPQVPVAVKKKGEDAKKKAEDAKKKAEDAKKKSPPKVGVPVGKNNTKPGKPPKKSEPKKATPKRSVTLEERDPLNLGDIGKDIKKELEKLRHKFGKPKNGTAPAAPAEPAANQKRDVEAEAKKDCDKKKDGKKPRKDRKGGKKNNGPKRPGKNSTMPMPKPKPATPKGKRSLPVRLPAMF